MPLAKLLMERFGVRVRGVENPLITVAQPTPLMVLGNNPNRLGFTLINLSANAMYLGLRNTVSATQGVYLPPNGGSVSLIWDEDFQIVAWAWWIVATGVDSDLYAIEVVEY